MGNTGCPNINNPRCTRLVVLIGIVTFHWSVYQISVLGHIYEMAP